jgi:hypothetical protein
MIDLTHLERLEAESITIFREVVAEAENPVMLYSVGKDSSVMLHLARKAFYPAPPPFPVLHVASGWDFKDLLVHRDRTVREYGLKLIIAANEEAEAQGINPFDTGLTLDDLSAVVRPGLDGVMVPKANGAADIVRIGHYLDALETRSGMARGTVIEAVMQPGRGPVARLLVEQGMMNVGDFVVIGRAFGRVRDMTNEYGKVVTEAGPSTPLELSGIDAIGLTGNHMNDFSYDNFRSTLQLYADKQMPIYGGGSDDSLTEPDCGSRQR